MPYTVEYTRDDRVVMSQKFETLVEAEFAAEFFSAYTDAEIFADGDTALESISDILYTPNN